MNEFNTTVVKVLFVCGSNSCRSQMAEGLLRARGGKRVAAFSAGTSAGGIHPLAARVMGEASLDISSQRSKALQDLPAVGFDLVITLCDNARGACFAPNLLPEEAQKRLFGGVPIFLHWGIDDPADARGDEEQQLAVFRAARERIREYVDGLLGLGYLEAFVRERYRLQRFADLLEDGVIIHDEFRHLFLVNEAFLHITGLIREDVVGRDCHSVFPAYGLCGSNCQYHDGTEGPEEKHEYQVQFLTAQGEHKDLKLTTEPLEIEPGKQGVLAIVRDETEVSSLRVQLGERRSFHGMVGVSALVQEVFRTIESVSASDYPVLITGESGTGKELVATAIHQESGRQGGPLVPVNCGALPENILESELFGHVRGAFTGAIRDKKGRFELADGGTLFLDEVGELPLPVQVKLLRVLQEKVFERVGGEMPVRVDVRVISATNCDLRTMVRQGKFREDLFYRLCVVPVELPALRQRREDIPYLVEHILERVRQESGKQIAGLDDRAHDLLLTHDWPGNIRELINALQFASVRCSGEVILSEHLPPELRTRPVVRLDTSGDSVAAANDPGMQSQPGVPLTPEPLREPDILRLGVLETAPSGRPLKLNRAAVEQALTRTGGNKARAAKLLGVGRATLYRYLSRLAEK